MAQGVHVTGLRQTVRSLERLGVDAGDLKDVMGDIAREGSRVAASFVPARTGALRATVRGNRAKARATVTVGRGRTNNYAAVVNYGWRARGIRPAGFVEKTDAAFADRAFRMLDAGVSDLVRRHGLD